MDVTELRRQHDRIMDLAGELRAAVERGDELQPVAAIRWRLARELMAHLAVEDRLFYPAMVRSADMATSGMATRLRTEMGGLSEAFTAYMARWSDLRVAREWDAFREETKAMLADLAGRIKRENEALYTLAEAAASRDASAEPAVSARAVGGRWPAA